MSYLLPFHLQSQCQNLYINTDVVLSRLGFNAETIHRQMICTGSNFTALVNFFQNKIRFGIFFSLYFVTTRVKELKVSGNFPKRPKEMKISTMQKNNKLKEIAQSCSTHLFVTDLHRRPYTLLHHRICFHFRHSLHR